MEAPEGSDLKKLVTGTEPLSDEHRALCELYRSSFSQYELFRASIETLIVHLLREEDIYATTESRAKDPASLENKLRRKQYHSLGEIPDLAGVRIVVRYLSDVKRAVKLLESEFTVQESFPHWFASPDAFGYVSHHLVVKLSAERQSLREWSRYSDLICEVQIRTILQHAWGSISHSLDYKSEEDVPTAVRRDLFRVAALLESGDEMFDRYRTAVFNLRESYASSDDWRKLPIDFESLQTQWDKLPVSRFVSAGDGRIEPGISDSELLRIVRCCKFLEINKLGELAEFLEEVDVDSTLADIGGWIKASVVKESFAIFAALYFDGRISSRESEYILSGTS